MGDGNRCTQTDNLDCGKARSSDFAWMITTRSQHSPFEWYLILLLRSDKSEQERLKKEVLQSFGCLIPNCACTQGWKNPRACGSNRNDERSDGTGGKTERLADHPRSRWRELGLFTQDFMHQMGWVKIEKGVQIVNKMLNPNSPKQKVKRKKIEPKKIARKMGGNHRQNLRRYKYCKHENGHTKMNKKETCPQSRISRKMKMKSFNNKTNKIIRKMTNM